MCWQSIAGSNLIPNVSMLSLMRHTVEALDGMKAEIESGEDAQARSV